MSLESSVSFINAVTALWSCNSWFKEFLSSSPNKSYSVVNSLVFMVKLFDTVDKRVCRNVEKVWQWKKEISCTLAMLTAWIPCHPLSQPFVSFQLIIFNYHLYHIVSILELSHCAKPYRKLLQRRKIQRYRPIVLGIFRVTFSFVNRNYIWSFPMVRGTLHESDMLNSFVSGAQIDVAIIIMFNYSVF